MPDFQEIKATLRQFILKRIAEHPADQPVKFIELGYEACQGGLFCVFMDTRPDAEPDGTWTVRLDGNSLEMPDWPQYVEDIGDDFIEELGETIRTLGMELRDEGAFAALPKQAGCEFGVEDMEGAYGWPMYEDRGKENLV